MESYCVKCREKREIKNAKSVIMKNGKPAIQGECSICGSKVYRIGNPASTPIPIKPA